SLGTCSVLTKDVAERKEAAIRVVVPLVMEGLILTGGVLALLTVEPCVEEHSLAAAERCGGSDFHLGCSQQEGADTFRVARTFIHVRVIVPAIFGREIAAETGAVNSFGQRKSAVGVVFDERLQDGVIRSLRGLLEFWFEIAEPYTFFER